MDVASALERYMLELINAERAAAGLGPVVLELNLNTAADAHSTWMVAADTFSHSGEAGSSHTDRIRAADFDLTGNWRTTENLAAVSLEGAEDLYDEVDRLHANLMNSPSHRDNILDPDVTHVGLGIVQGPLTYSNGVVRESLLVTQNFAATTTGVLDLDLAGGSAADTLTGGQGDDNLQGGDGSDLLRTGTGGDTVEAGSGNDRIDVGSGQGDKAIWGGTGSDTVILGLARGDVSFALEAGRLVVQTAVGRLVLDGVETLQLSDGALQVADLIAGLSGTHLTGTTADERLTGGSGTDLIEGGGGSDTLEGGAGDDIMLADGAGLMDSDAGAQVYRLFDTVLGRAPAQSGLEGFARQLLTGAQDLEGLAARFVESAEFQLRYGDTSNSEFVTLLFNNVFGRDPAESGLAAWTAKLDSGQSRAEVVRDFSETAEHVIRTRAGLESFTEAKTAANWSDEVYRLFGAVLGREPGASGMESWTNALAEGRTVEEAVAQFMGSTEFQRVYGDTSDSDFITLLFNNVLGRDPAQSGLEAWTGRLENGETRVEVVRSFMDAAEYVNRTTPLLESFMRNLGIDDTLRPGAGDSLLAGGFGADAFVFGAGDDGDHHILDFEAWDSLQLQGFGYADAGEALAQFSQSGADVVFEDQGVRIVLDGWDLTQLSETMIDLE